MRLAFPLLALAAVTSCVQPAPRPVVSPPPRLASVRALPPAPPVPADWRDWPQTPGDWRYRPLPSGGVAEFGPPGQPLLAMRCLAGAGRVQLVRREPIAAPMTVRTTTLTRTLPTAATDDGAAATLAASDPLLDAIGFSRGRFVIEQPSLPPLVLPAWAEVERVTEDCRG